MSYICSDSPFLPCSEGVHPLIFSAVWEWVIPHVEQGKESHVGHINAIPETDQKPHLQSSYLLLLPSLYSPLWALACWTMSIHSFLFVATNLHLLTPITWTSSCTSTIHLFLGRPLRLVFSSPWLKIFLSILSCSILCRWPSHPIICPLIHLTIFSPLVISSSSWLVLLFHSPFSYFGSYILLSIFLSSISNASSPFLVIVHTSAPYVTTVLISVFYSRVLLALDRKRLLKRLIAAKYALFPVLSSTIGLNFLRPYRIKCKWCVVLDYQF